MRSKESRTQKRFHLRQEIMPRLSREQRPRALGMLEVVGTPASSLQRSCHRALGLLEVGQSQRDSCINAAGGHTQY